MRSCENAIGLMKNLQSSIQVEESWVDGTIESLSAMPTATSTYELDVSTIGRKSMLILFQISNFSTRFSCVL